MFGLSVCCITLFWTAGVSHSVRVAKMNRNWLILQAVQLIRSLVSPITTRQIEQKNEPEEISISQKVEPPSEHTYSI